MQTPERDPRLQLILQEYEKIAFGTPDEVKPADRIRALDRLMEIYGYSTGEESSAQPLVIRTEYI